MKVTQLNCTPTPPTNVPTKYQLPTPYGFLRYSMTNFPATHTPTHLDTLGINNTSTALQGCGVISTEHVQMHFKCMGLGICYSLFCYTVCYSLTLICSCGTKLPGGWFITWHHEMTYNKCNPSYFLIWITKCGS